MNQYQKIISVIITVIFTSSCGFVLEEQAYSSEYINSYGIDFISIAPNSLLSQEMRRLIELSEFRPNSSGEGLRINIRDEALNEEIFTLSLNNLPTEYEITYTVSFEVLLEGRVIRSLDTITLSRVYGFDLNNLIAKQRESLQIQRELARGLADRILQQL